MLAIIRILTTLEEYIIAIGGVVESMALDIELLTLKSFYLGTLSEIRNIVANTYRWGYLYSCSTTPCQKNLAVEYI